MTKLTELAGVLSAIDTKLEKAKAEIVSEIDTLKVSLSAVDLPIDAQIALDNLGTIAQALDDIVPDAPAPTA